MTENHENLATLGELLNERVVDESALEPDRMASSIENLSGNCDTADSTCVLALRPAAATLARGAPDESLQ
jgi:hypothetical protein